EGDRCMGARFTSRSDELRRRGVEDVFKIFHFWVREVHAVTGGSFAGFEEPRSPRRSRSSHQHLYWPRIIDTILAEKPYRRIIIRFDLIDKLILRIRQPQLAIVHFPAEQPLPVLVSYPVVMIGIEIVNNKIAVNLQGPIGTSNNAGQF